MRTALLISAIMMGSIPVALAVPAVGVPRANDITELGKVLTADNHYGSPNPPWHPSGKPGWYYGPHPEKAPGIPCLTPDTCKALDSYPHAIHCPHSYPPPRPPHHPPPSPPHYPPPPPLPHYPRPPPPPHYPRPPPPPHYPPPPPPHHSPPPPPPPHSPPPHSSHPPPPPYTTQPHTSKTTEVPYTTEPTSATTIYTSPTPTYTPPPPPPSDGYQPTFYNITAAVQADDYMTFGLVETVDDCKAMCDKVEGCGFVNTYHDVNGKDGSPLLSCALFKLCHGAEDADNRGGQSQPDGTINFITDSNGWCKE